MKCNTMKTLKMLTQIFIINLKKCLQYISKKRKLDSKETMQSDSIKKHVYMCVCICVCVYTHIYNVYVCIKNTLVCLYVLHMYVYIHIRQKCYWQLSLDSEIRGTFWGDISLWSHFLKFLSNQTKADLLNNRNYLLFSTNYKNILTLLN